jgi:hypothetical protein
MPHNKLGAHVDEELVEDNFTSTHRLSLRVDSHSSTLSFTLETLAQHRTLIGKLQDEVDFLRRQGEMMQTKLDAREAPSETSVQSQNEAVNNRPGTSAKMLLPDLNVALVPPVDEDLIKKEK